MENERKTWGVRTLETVVKSGIVVAVLGWVAELPNLVVTGIAMIARGWGGKKLIEA